MIDPSLLVAVTGFTSFVEGDPKYLTVADMERAAGIPKKIRRAVRAYIAGTEWPGLDLEKVAYDWRKLSKAITDFDDTDVNAMAKLIGGLPVDPMVSGGYVGALQRAINYVRDAMPLNADVQMTGVRARDPSRTNIYRWGRCVAVAEEPLCVLEWLHGGRLTTQAVECITGCYPPILDTMVTAAVEALATSTAKGGWTLPRDKERQLSLLLGSFAAPGLQQAIQALLDEESDKAKEKSPPVSSTSRVAKQFHSTTKEA